MKKFEYKYTAPTQNERNEIERIRSQYIKSDKQEQKFQLLRKLDNKVKSVPAIISLILGIFGVLLFGLGLTMILEWGVLIWGCVVSVIGCVPMAVAYFAYNKIYQSMKNKYSEQIIKLSGELLNDKE